MKKAFAESPEIWYEAQRLATEAAAAKTRGVPRPKDVRDKISVGHRKDDYATMHAFFLSLPTGMHLSEKTRLLRERFPDVNHSTFYFRLRKWTDQKGSKRLRAYQEVYEFFLTLPEDMPLPRKRHLMREEFPNVRRYLINRWLRKWSGSTTRSPYHPDYPDAHNYFLSLPTDMSLPEKRLLLHKEFPNVKRFTLNKWIRQWSGTKILKRHPAYSDAYNFYLSLPADMLLSEKRRLMIEKFPNIKPDTVWSWTNKWQPNDSAFKRHERQKNREQGYELFMSLPCDLTIEEKRKFLREKMPHVNRRTIFDWTVKWQSELEATQQQAKF